MTNILPNVGKTSKFNQKAYELQQKGLLNHQEVLALINVSKSTLSRWVKLRRFPEPIRVPGTQLILWDRETVFGWMRQKKEEALQRGGQTSEAA